MAQVTTKKGDTKYAHLQKVYQKSEEKLKKSTTPEAKIEFKTEEITISTAILRKDLLLVALLAAAAVLGYVITRFVY